MKYRHYKGGMYELVCEARLESDPDVIMIIYRAQDGATWARPREVFFEWIEFEGKLVKRFEPIN